MKNKFKVDFITAFKKRRSKNVHELNADMQSTFKVDFIGIGAERAATTWISDCLSQHPEISFARQKELYFFNKLDRHFLRLISRRYGRGIEWYERQFEPDNGKTIKGEFSPTYLYCPFAAERIKRHFPEVKLIVSLRDPVSRAYSQYFHNKRVGVIANISFERALKEVRSFIEKGFYRKHLRRYYSLFPRRNIKVVIFEDIISNPKKVIKELYKFLGLKDIEYEPPSLHLKSNESKESRWGVINYILTQTEIFLREMEMGWIIRILEKLGIRKLAFNFAHYVNVREIGKKPKMRRTTKEKLRKIYLDDTVKLEKLLHRDLSAWKQASSFKEN